MTTVTFHFNVSDRFDYVCRLARKALATDTRAVLVADGDTLDRLDRELWCATPTDFLAHCLSSAAPDVLARSPVVLTFDLQLALPAGVLINLSETVPQGHEAFDRVIEVVGLDEPERAAARQRWRHYADSGLQLTRFDASSHKVPA